MDQPIQGQTTPPTSMQETSTVATSSTTQSTPINEKTHSTAWPCYFLGWLTGLIFYFTTKDKFVKFHAAQSILVFGALHILQMLLVPRVGFMYMMSSVDRPFVYSSSPLSSLISLVCFILWIVLMVKAYKGEKYMLPVIGEWAEKMAAK